MKTARKTLVATVDCGTSEIKAAVFDLSGKTKGVIEKACPCIYYGDGGIEQNPQLIVKQAFSCLKKAIERFKINPKNIASVSISTQRATVICIDKKGKPLGNAVSWQDMRGAGAIDALRRKIDDKRYYNITGIPNNPVFSLAKILWIKKNRPAVYKRTARFALVHDYLLKELGCGDFFSDWSNASLTGMFDVAMLRWCKDILKLAGIKEERLSVLVPSGKKVGTVSKKASKACGLLEGTAIISGGGDQQCAGLGAGCVKEGIAEITLGTAGVSLCYSSKVKKDSRMRVSCCAHVVPGRWEVEGLQNSAGSSLKWVNEIVSEGKKFSRQFFRKLSEIKPGSQGVFFYPFLAGASAPNWNPQAKAMFLGLMHIHDKASIVRAVMEGVSLETRQILEVFASLRIPVKEIRLTGGCSNIDVWNQIQADIYGRDVSTLENPHASLLGAAILAAWGAGAFDSIKGAAERMVKIKKRYTPITGNTQIYQGLYRKYCEIYKDLDKNKILKTIS